MPWIDIIEDADADGELREVYDSITRARGKLSNVVRVQSLNARALQAHMSLYAATVYGRMSLRRADRELIAVVVSVANQCPYCIHHHAEALNAYWKDSERVSLATEEFRKLDLSEAQLAMCEYAEKLTLFVADATEDDVDSLRSAGFTDEEILNITLITSYFNFVNRITLSLGVEYSKSEIAGYSFNE